MQGGGRLGKVSTQPGKRLQRAIGGRRQRGRGRRAERDTAGQPFLRQYIDLAPCRNAGGRDQCPQRVRVLWPVRWRAGRLGNRLQPICDPGQQIAWAAGGVIDVHQKAAARVGVNQAQHRLCSSRPDRQRTGRVARRLALKRVRRPPCEVEQPRGRLRLQDVCGQLHLVGLGMPARQGDRRGHPKAQWPPGGAVIASQQQPGDRHSPNTTFAATAIW